MRDIAFRQQILTTLLLLAITFGLWMAAEPLLATPAKWLAHALLTFWLPQVIETTIFEPGALLVVTKFTEMNGIIRLAIPGEEGLAFRLNTRLVSYGLPFYAALLWGSRIAKPFNTFAWGLFVLWAAMALGLAAMTAKDLDAGYRRAFPRHGLGSPIGRHCSELSVQCFAHANLGARAALGAATERLSPLDATRESAGKPSKQRVDLKTARMGPSVLPGNRLTV